MRLSIRFVLPLILVLGLIAYGIVPLVNDWTVNWFIRDLEGRTQLVVATVQDSLVRQVQSKASRRISALFERMLEDGKLHAVGFCDPDNTLAYRSRNFPQQITCQKVVELESRGQKIVELSRGPIYVSFEPVQDEGVFLGHLLVIHDMSFIQKWTDDTKRYIFYFFTLLALVVSGVTVLIAHLSLRGWVTGIRSLIHAAGFRRQLHKLAAPGELNPIAKDLRTLIRELESDRRVRDESQIQWSARTLKEILQKDLAGDQIIIASHREPYHHRWNRGKIEVQVPASGLVTALEPVMRACSGTWIAHGSGNADRETVDHRDHVRVPPDKPSYEMRRIWLSPEEEKGFYYGFANEGLWPLCHIAHTRPTFRAEDWRAYYDVNRKFADAVVQEAQTEDPVVWVQDYHFALLPRMIKKQLPNAIVITFWHIPWPNPEAFGICPWREEILDGLLGSNILGFHTRFHCNNFVDTADRFVECRTDRELSTISYGGKLTAVNAYPISIEWPVRWVKNQKSIPECRALIRSNYHFVPDLKVGIGVDRLDYTKGILERFLAVERLLEIAPEWLGKFTFVQIAAPSRTSIEQYQMFDAQVRALAQKINVRFSRSGYQPIVLKIEHEEPSEVYQYFRAADLCFVSSLHDGMNLVAKEFVGARDDEQGVLILSQFTGASRELTEALIVNPYNIDQSALALKTALEMPPAEQQDRMRSMRGHIQEFNVYRWAGRMLMDAGRLRKQNRFLGKFGESPFLSVQPTSNAS